VGILIFVSEAPKLLQEVFGKAFLGLAIELEGDNLGIDRSAKLPNDQNHKICGWTR
jgi:hypothetical protein